MFYFFLVIFDFGVWNMAVWSEDLVRGKFRWYIACLITSLFVVFYFLKWELPKAYLKPRASHIIFVKDLFCRDKIMTRCVVSAVRKMGTKKITLWKFMYNLYGNKLIFLWYNLSWQFYNISSLLVKCFDCRPNFIKNLCC